MRAKCGIEVVIILFQMISYKVYDKSDHNGFINGFLISRHSIIFIINKDFTEVIYIFLVPDSLLKRLTAKQRLTQVEAPPAGGHFNYQRFGLIGVAQQGFSAYCAVKTGADIIGKLSKVLGFLSNDIQVITTACGGSKECGFHKGYL